MNYVWDFAILGKYSHLFWLGLGWTAAYTIGTIFLGTVIGLVVGILRLRRPLVIDWLLLAYIELFRCTPLLVQITKIDRAAGSLSYRYLASPACWEQQVRRITQQGRQFEVTEKVGRTGLVAIYTNGDGPTILVRTELDALPMEEKTGLDYASRDKTNWNGKETFVAHSCGHDIHMASWVGTAKPLPTSKSRRKAAP